jgi:hypothetical protein
MMFPEFMTFYHYTAEQALAEYAKRFFSLLNSMYRIQAKEQYDDLMISSTAYSGGKEAESLAKKLQDRSKGNQKILEEVRIIKR